MARSTRRQSARPRFAICVDGGGYETALMVRRLYRTLPDKEAESHRLLRVVDESGEDYLFPASLFVCIELTPAASRRIAAAM